MKLQLAKTLADQLDAVDSLHARGYRWVECERCKSTGKQKDGWRDYDAEGAGLSYQCLDCHGDTGCWQEPEPKIKP